VTDAWMPGAERIPAPADGGCLKGGAPRAVWLPVHANPLVLSARAVVPGHRRRGRPPARTVPPGRPGRSGRDRPGPTA